MAESVIIAFANQKGGVGKTTSAVNTAAALGALAHRTLLVDLDPQGNASSGVGINKKKTKNGTYEVLIGRCSAEEAIQTTAFAGLDVLPATISLAAAEIELADVPHRELVLREALAAVRDRYSFVVIDCPPSLSLLTINALAAADGVVIPMQCEYYALEGLTQLMMTIRRVKQSIHPPLTITGILVTMHNGRLNLSVQVLEELKKYYADKLFRTLVGRSVRLSEAPSFGKPILYYDRTSKAAEQYMDVARELIGRTR